MIKHIKLNQDNLAFAIEVQREIFPYDDATKKYTEMVNGENDNNYFLVYNGDECIGVSGLAHYGADVEDGFLGWFGILPKYRRLGLGSEALRLLDETARDLGYRRMRVIFNTETGFPGAKTFLKVNGYTAESYQCPRDRVSLSGNYAILSRSLYNEPCEPWNNRNLHLTEEEK
ncbi:acetyltransferase (GNAT) family protein [Anaeroplasma bactoclasticum]|jgi:GNAT superfamily N-acetyltransferase|uniref:Acetyltransferase (GNAT) family protein n=1 Tax=Anaeroplasma bactoclasticum TaxID=2088 RepID=A0A397S0K1_9MOLU|nr:GNAT family N-acetyltransferase [Anaeroplasma bactoclasticum]RIA75704.1 acetyltransferase (GNAT) family protein [Anaeroplasma bactoclasticum]